MPQIPESHAQEHLLRAQQSIQTVGRLIDQAGHNLDVNPEGLYFLLILIEEEINRAIMLIDD